MRIRCLRSRDVCAVDCQLKGDSVWVGILLLKNASPQVENHTVYDIDTTPPQEYRLLIPPNLPSLAYKCTIALTHATTN